MTDDVGRVYDRAARLADRYRELAAELLVAAHNLDNATVEQLATRPVRYVHARARALEEQLDEALAAL